MPLAGFEPTISAGERLQTFALDRAAIGTHERNTWQHITPNVITVALLYCVTHFFSFHFCIICHFSMLTHICPKEGGSTFPSVTDGHLPDHSAMSCHVMPQTTAIHNSVVPIHVPPTEFKHNKQCNNLPNFSTTTL